MSLHADVAAPARDRRRLERLCHYVGRPPLASDRLEERPDGRLALRLKTRWRDGTTHILMEPNELLERLVPLIPPPRAHQVRYHGVLAPCASARDRVVPGPRPPPRPVGALEVKEPSTETIPESAGMQPAGPTTPPRQTDPWTPTEPASAGRLADLPTARTTVQHAGFRKRWTATPISMPRSAARAREGSQTRASVFARSASW